MVATTPQNALRLAELTDGPANIQTAFSNLGTDLDSRIVPRFTSTAARDAAIVSPVAGQLCHLDGTGSGLRVLQRYSGSAWRNMQEMPGFARKTADETVTSSATLQNDDHLVLAVEANSFYVVELKIFHVCASDTPDINFGFTFPSGATFTWSTLALTPAASGVTIGTATFLAILAGVTPSTGGQNAGVVGNATCTRIDGVLNVGATAGNLQFQWAQAVSNASGVTVATNSWMRASRAA